MLSDRPILATLAYYDGFRWPLTIAELHERLIPSGRLEVSDARPDIGALVARVDALVRSGQVRSDLGLYASAGADGGIFASRVVREKEHAQKWRRMRRHARWLQGVPFVRALNPPRP